MASKPIHKLEVCASLLREHRQMESLLAQLEQALGDLALDTPESLEPLRSVMNRIEPEMNTHFACEEQALFPGVEPYHSMVLMEVEHEELIAMRDRLLQLVRQEEDALGAIGEVRELGSRFISDMLDHIGREDAGIFPTCEQSLSDQEKEAIMEKMDRIRAEAADTPSPSINRPERSFKSLTMDLDAPAPRPIFSERLTTDSEPEMKHLVLQAGASLPAHWSPKQVTLVCLKGTGTFTANGDTVALQPGSTIVMTPQLTHGLQAHADSDCHLLLLLS